MENIKIEYKIKSASEDDIFSHLTKCKLNFLPPLDETVSIQGYSKKIYENSITFEGWSENQLVGLASVYFNNTEEKKGFITNVSTFSDFMGLGIASKLILMVIQYARANHFKEIGLEVNSENKPAIKLYRKFKFNEVSTRNKILTMSLLID